MAAKVLISKSETAWSSWAPDAETAHWLMTHPKLIDLVESGTRIILEFSSTTKNYTRIDDDTVRPVVEEFFTELAERWPAGDAWARTALPDLAVVSVNHPFAVIDGEKGEEIINTDKLKFMVVDGNQVNWIKK